LENIPKNNVCSTILKRTEENYKDCLSDLEKEDLDEADICSTMIWEDGNLMDILKCPPKMYLRARECLKEVNEGIEKIRRQKIEERLKAIIV